LIGCGVRIRKRNSGGVMLSRLAASAKKANTASRGSGRLMDVLKTRVDTPLIVAGAIAPPTAGRFRRLSSLRDPAYFLSSGLRLATAA
jgi:hypothetical protein